MKALCSFLMLIGRLSIAAIFLLAGFSKFLDYDGTLAYMIAKGVPYVPYTLYAAALVEIIGGALLVFGYKTRFAATLLALFLIPVTYMMHDFWNVSEPAVKALETINFLKNLAIFGGLLYVICFGSGGCACDRCCSGDCPTTKP